MKRTVASLLTFASNVAAVAAALAIVSGSAFADDITTDSTPFVSTKSRAEVRSELTRPSEGRSPGEREWLVENSPAARTASTEARIEAKAAYIVSREYLRALTSEDSGSAVLGSPDVMRRVSGRTTMGAAGR